MDCEGPAGARALQGAVGGSGGQHVWTLSLSQARPPSAKAKAAVKPEPTAPPGGRRARARLPVLTQPCAAVNEFSISTVI